MQNQKAVNQYEKARVLHQKGKLSDAERFYKKAIKNNKNFVEARSNLGNVLLDLGRIKEAVVSYSKALKLLPDHPLLLNNLGNALQMLGENEEAISWLNEAIVQDPNYADAYCNLGNAQRVLGRAEEAIASYKRAISIAPDLADTYNNLGAILMELNEVDDAATNFKKAIEIEPGFIEAYNGLGNALSDKGDIDKAVASYYKAIELDPGYSEAYHGLGNAISEQGELVKAIALYRKAIEIDPEYIEAYQSLARNKKFLEYDDDVRSMEFLYAKQCLSEEQKTGLAFSLGKVYEDLGRYETAMELFIAATRLKRASFDYSITEAEDLFRDIKEKFSLKFFSVPITVGNSDQTPIFILGMPRSGTSLVEQILASHPNVVGAGELSVLLDLIKKLCATDSSKGSPTFISDLDSELFKDLGKEYIARIRNHSKSAKYITDKMPHNFLRIGFIKTILPNAKIIHLTRDPMDNCLSIFKNDFSSGHAYSYDMTELGQYYHLYLDLMKYWRNNLPDFIYDLNYEELVDDQEGQVRKLLEYCNLPWDDACLEFHKTRRKVKTASNAQVRQPIYKDSVNLWKRYEKQLQPLHDAIYN
jgi:tetratricopeptide (TPR) repeat protein